MNGNTFGELLTLSHSKPEHSFTEFVQKQQALMPSPPDSPESFWWVEIMTTVPMCTYYFGPFESKDEARNSRSGYVDDLIQEEARGIIALVKQCQPMNLTVGIV